MASCRKRNGQFARCAVGVPRRRQRAEPVTLEVGRTIFTDKGLRIHHYQGSVQVTDMKNAGLRGKSVSRMSILPAHHLGRDEESQALSSVISMAFLLSYSQLRTWLRSRSDFRVEERNLRGVDVEPMATEIHLSRTFADKSKIDVTASPHAFRVRSSVPLVSDRHPGRYTQDTLYYEGNKAAAKKFYAWLQKNLARADKMTISELRDVWACEGIGYDYQ